ncbi:hypothetical protein Scep_029259 [Stephania cephalantha]|uniref:Uncharacterized protein n=1 Tax=Stephania cephalantha TaxID=152367 RepID=A0AAP0E0M5_9MAGN
MGCGGGRRGGRGRPFQGPRRWHGVTEDVGEINGVSPDGGGSGGDGDNACGSGSRRGGSGDAVTRVGQRCGGALPGRSIPDKTTMVDKAL